jgi:hypothetical protein
MSVFLLAMVDTAFAEPLFPARVGLRWEYNRWDSDDPVNQWPVHFEITSQVTYNSVDYFQFQGWNDYNDGAYEDTGYLRSTEQAAYWYNPSGADYLDFQKAPVGTAWSYYQPDGSGLDYQFQEIVAIEPVTVPYGTFTTAYKHRNYQCVNSDGTGNPSPYWYEWIVPGVGMVKEVDHYVDNVNPPLTRELVRVIIVADFDIGRDTLSLKSNAKWITCYIRFPAGYSLVDIDLESILLNGVVTPNRTRFHKAKQMLIVRFYRSEVQAIVEPGEVELTVSGELTDGTKFEGADTIMVID